jgi:hypothetical protein
MHLTAVNDNVSFGDRLTDDCNAMNIDPDNLPFDFVGMLELMVRRGQLSFAEAWFMLMNKKPAYRIMSTYQKFHNGEYLGFN